MKARPKCRLAGPTTGCWTNQATCIEEKQRVRQTAVRYTQKSNQIYIWISTRTNTMYVCMYDCLRSESESASHSSPPQLKGVRVLSACVRVCVLTAVVHVHKSWQKKKQIRSYAWVKHKSDCVFTEGASVCAVTISLIHPLCLSVCLYMYVLMCVYTMLRCYACATSIWC